MKLYKFFSIFIMTLLFSSVVFSQNLTTLTGTVIDSDSQAWDYATWTANIVVPGGGGNAVFTSGGIVPSSYSGILSNAGAITGYVANGSAMTPPNTMWSFTVCPLVSSPCQTIPAIYIYGSTVNIGTYISSMISAPRIQSAKLSYAYNAAEIVNMVQGNGYINTNTGTNYFWNGTAWASLGSGGGLSGQTVNSLPLATSATSSTISSVVSQSGSKIGVDQLTPLYPLDVFDHMHVGSPDINIAPSQDPTVTVSRNLTTAQISHAYTDDTQISNTQPYGSYDARVELTSAAGNIDHEVGFQTITTLDAGYTGTLSRLLGGVAYGYINCHSCTVASMANWEVDDVQTTNTPTLPLNYGIHCTALVKATVNWCLYSDTNDIWVGGHSETGTGFIADRTNSTTGIGITYETTNSPVWFSGFNPGNTTDYVEGGSLTAIDCVVSTNICGFPTGINIGGFVTPPAAGILNIVGPSTSQTGIAIKNTSTGGTTWGWSTAGSSPPTGVSTGDIVLSYIANAASPPAQVFLDVNASRFNFVLPIVSQSIGTTPNTSPICPNGTGGAFTTTGCASGSSIGPNPSGPPTITCTTTGCGTGGTVTVTGNDGSGYITINSGTGTTSGALFTMTFAGTYSNTMNCVFYPRSSQTLAVLTEMWMITDSNTFVQTDVNAAIPSSTSGMTMNYLCHQ